MTQPDVLGLTKESVAALTEPLERIPLDGINVSFAQGIVTEPILNGKKVCDTIFWRCFVPAPCICIVNSLPWAFQTLTVARMAEGSDRLACYRFLIAAGCCS